MSVWNTATHYGVVTRLLHWSVALLVVGLIGLGWWMVGLSYYDRWYNDSLELHKALGIVVLVLGPLKVVWTLCNPTVRPAGSPAAWERVCARAVHAALLVLMVLIPVTGYLISTSAGDGIALFGLIEVPALVRGGPELRDAAIDLHYGSAYGAAVLVVLHAGGALKHQILDHDGTLRRMLW